MPKNNFNDADMLEEFRSETAEDAPQIIEAWESFKQALLESDDDKAKARFADEEDSLFLGFCLGYADGYEADQVFGDEDVAQEMLDSAPEATKLLWETIIVPGAAMGGPGMLDRLMTHETSMKIAFMLGISAGRANPELWNDEAEDDDDE